MDNPAEIQCRNLEERGTDKERGEGERVGREGGDRGGRGEGKKRRGREMVSGKVLIVPTRFYIRFFFSRCLIST